MTGQPKLELVPGARADDVASPCVNVCRMDELSGLCEGCLRTIDEIASHAAGVNNEIVGQAARDLFADAQAMLKRIIDEKWFTAKGVVGFWPARADGDDIIVFADETRDAEIARFHTQIGRAHV